MKNDRRTFSEYRVQFADGTAERVRAYDRVEAENSAIFERQNRCLGGAAVECVGVVRAPDESRDWVAGSAIQPGPGNGAERADRNVCPTVGGGAELADRNVCPTVGGGAELADRNVCPTVGGGVCKWSPWETVCGEDENAWSTQCGHEFTIIDGSLADNNFSHCPFCGGKIQENCDGAERADRNVCPTGEQWTVTPRSYHGELEPPPCYLVHEAGALRGVCECWDELDALWIATLLNEYGLRPFQRAEEGGAE